MQTHSSPKTENIIFFDDHTWHKLLPLTFTRPISDIRIGQLTISEKWLFHLGGEVSHKTIQYLSGKYPCKVSQDNILINGAYLPTMSLVHQINSLRVGEGLFSGESRIALRLDKKQALQFNPLEGEVSVSRIEVDNSEQPILRIERPWQILSLIQGEILSDIKLLTKGKKSEKLSNTNTVLGPYPVFSESGVQAECVIFNTTNGPIYLGKNSEVMEGSMIRGSFALGEGSTVNMGAKIYGPTAVGPKCKVGGEIKGCQFFGNANKGHDGFLGDSVIGEWCNLGADTNTSNLKNNYLPVRAWSYVEEKFIDTGLQFCGLIIGDHSKCGINTMFNTGTIVGAYSNIFGEGYPRTFIPSFAWGGASGFQTHPMKKALETAAIVMTRRGLLLTEEDKKIADSLFDLSAKYRAWEK